MSMKSGVVLSSLFEEACITPLLKKLTLDEDDTASRVESICVVKNTAAYRQWSGDIVPNSC